MEIFIPKTIAEYEPELRLVFDLMVAKLNMNRHKGFGESTDFAGLVRGTENELAEMFAAAKLENQTATMIEAIDVSNMGALVAIMMLRMTKQDFKNLQRGLQNEQ